MQHGYHFINLGLMRHVLFGCPVNTRKWLWVKFEIILFVKFKFKNLDNFVNGNEHLILNSLILGFCKYLLNFFFNDLPKF